MMQIRKYVFGAPGALLGFSVGALAYLYAKQKEHVRIYGPVPTFTGHHEAEVDLAREKPVEVVVSE